MLFHIRGILESVLETEAETSHQRISDRCPDFGIKSGILGEGEKVLTGYVETETLRMHFFHPFPGEGITYLETLDLHIISFVVVEVGEFVIEGLVESQTRIGAVGVLCRIMVVRNPSGNGLGRIDKSRVVDAGVPVEVETEGTGEEGVEIKSLPLEAKVDTHGDLRGVAVACEMEVVVVAVVAVAVKVGVNKVAVVKSVLRQRLPAAELIAGSDHGDNPVHIGLGTDHTILRTGIDIDLPFAGITGAGAMIALAYILVAQNVVFQDIATETALGDITYIIYIVAVVVFVGAPLLHEFALVLLDGGDIVGKVDTDGIAEVLSYAVTPLEGQFEAFVLDRSKILPRRGDVAHRHKDRRLIEDAGGVADVAVDLTGEAVAEEAEIDADVAGAGRLPLKLAVAEGPYNQAGSLLSA